MTLNLVSIPVGSFLMGSARGDAGETPQHTVSFGKSFYMGAFQITEGQWQTVMGSTAVSTDVMNFPVINVSWDDLRTSTSGYLCFLDALNLATTSTRPSGMVFRLPSEAEWEYACRAGTTTLNYWGDDLAQADAYAWYWNNAGIDRRPVGTRKPNDWGLYDIQGNFGEWCEDDGHPDYTGAPTDGSPWVDAPHRNTDRIIRGGGLSQDLLRSSFRNQAPCDTAVLAGLRVVLAPGSFTPPSVTPTPTPTPTPNPTPNEAARPLSSLGENNLVAFAKLYGYVRFFHPSSEAQAVSWDAFAADGIRAVENANDASVLQTTLTQLFAPYAPTIQVFAEGESPDLPAELTPRDLTGLSLVYWDHYGIGLDSSNGSPYHSQRTFLEPNALPSGRSRPDQPFEASLGSGLRCRIPLSLFADSQHATLPKATAAPQDLLPIRTGGDRATRLADLTTTWNIIQYFWAYMDDISMDWEAELRSTLREAANQEGSAPFADTLQKMMASLHDGHAWVNSNAFRTASNPYPFTVQWIENRWVVCGRTTDCPDAIQLGDVLLTLEGESLTDLEARYTPLTPSATVQGTKALLPGYFLESRGKSTAELQVLKPSGKTESLVASLMGARFSGSPEPRPAKDLVELKPGVWYLDLTRLKDLQAFNELLDRLTQAKGLIVDMRGYPADWNIWHQLVGHLAKQDMPTIPFMVPTPVRPDHPCEFFNSCFDVIPVQTPNLKTKTVFLTDGRAISQAEFLMAIVSGYQLGEIVGEATAGTDGNINPFSLPGGYGVWWTGMKVLNVDGSRHFQIGVQPTVPCQRTIAGVAAGKDELLEKALSLIP